MANCTDIPLEDAYSVVVKPTSMACDTTPPEVIPGENANIEYHRRLHTEQFSRFVSCLAIAGYL